MAKPLCNDAPANRFANNLPLNIPVAPPTINGTNTSQITPPVHNALAAPAKPIALIIINDVATARLMPIRVTSINAGTT